MADQAEIMRAVRQVLFNEVFPAAKGGPVPGAIMWTGSLPPKQTYHDRDDNELSWREWIRREMKDMLDRHLRGHDMTHLPAAVQQTLDRHVREAVRSHTWLRDKKEFGDHVRKLAQEEATKIAERLIKESFCLDVKLEGSVHQPARVSRATNLGD